jgi:hypothetical protein
MEQNWFRVNTSFSLSIKSVYLFTFPLYNNFKIFKKKLIIYKIKNIFTLRFIEVSNYFQVFYMNIIFISLN